MEQTFTATKPIEQAKFPLKALPRRAANPLMPNALSLPRLVSLAGLAVTVASGLACVTAVALLVPLSEPVARVGLVLLTALHVLAAGGLVIAGAFGEYAVRTSELAKSYPVCLSRKGTHD